MFYCTRAQTRKRQLQPETDRFNCIQHTLPKIRKIATEKNMMPTINENPNEPSSEIVAGTQEVVQNYSAVSEQATNRSSYSTSGSEIVDSDDRSSEVPETPNTAVLLTQASLESEVNKIKNDMAALMKTMGQLAKNVESLSRVNNRLNETACHQNTPMITHFDRNYSPNEIRTSTYMSSGQVRDLGKQPNCEPDGIRHHSETPIQNIASIGLPQNDRGIRQNRDLNGEQIRIRVDKFGIVFDGNTSHMSVDDFIFRLERLQAQYDIPWSEILRDFRLLVVGQAHEWFWLYTKNHIIHDWPELRHALESQYKTIRSNFELMRDLAERRQQSHESIDAYFLTMGQLRSKLLQPISEYEMIKIMKRNIRESVGRIVYPMMISSVEQLRMECIEAEKNFPRRDPRGVVLPQRPVRHVNEAFLEPVEYVEEEMRNEYGDDIVGVAAIDSSSQQPKQVVCWNCRISGHVFMECPSTQRSLFCYKCGKPGVTKPRCPICSLENSKRGVGMTGNPRRSENPATIKQ